MIFWVFILLHNMVLKTECLRKVWQILSTLEQREKEVVSLCQSHL